MWNFSKHHKICNDGKGNINNIIDITLPKPDNLALNKQNSKDEEIPYPSNTPHRRDLHLESENIPDIYKDRHDLNNMLRQNKIWSEYFKFIYNRYNSVNTSYESCAIPSHVFMYFFLIQKSFKYTY